MLIEKCESIMIKCKVSENEEDDHSKRAAQWMDHATSRTSQTPSSWMPNAHTFCHRPRIRSIDCLSCCFDAEANNCDPSCATSISVLSDDEV